MYLKGNDKKGFVRNKAFTLVELLVVISIIGLLSMIIFDGLQESKLKSKDATIKSNLITLRNVGALFFDNNQKYTDTLVDINLADFLSFHHDQDTIGTIALTSVVDTSTFGEVILHGSKITKFIEKPKKGRQTSQLINCGLYAFESSIFSYLPARGFALLEDVFTKLALQKQLSGFIFEGRWVDISTPKSYETAIKIWGSGENPP